MPTTAAAAIIASLNETVAAQVFAPPIAPRTILKFAILVVHSTVSCAAMGEGR